METKEAAAMPKDSPLMSRAEFVETVLNSAEFQNFMKEAISVAYDQREERTILSKDDSVIESVILTRSLENVMRAFHIRILANGNSNDTPASTISGPSDAG